MNVRFTKTNLGGRMSRKNSIKRKKHSHRKLQHISEKFQECLLQRRKKQYWDAEGVIVLFGYERSFSEQQQKKKKKEEERKTCGNAHWCEKKKAICMASMIRVKTQKNLNNLYYFLY